MVLSRLVIFLFHPLTQDNVRLRQVLNVFFPFFASLDVANQQQLEAAFLPTIKTIQKAPCTSPLAEMDITMIVKFFVNLTQVIIAFIMFSVNGYIYRLQFLYISGKFVGPETRSRSHNPRSACNETVYRSSALP